MTKPVGTCTPRFPGRRWDVSSPAFRSRMAAAVCSPAGTAPLPGFGLAQARSRSARGARRAHRASSVTSPWGAEWLCLATVGIQAAVQDSTEWLRSTLEEVETNLRPPSQLRAAWHSEQPAPRRMLWIAMAGYFVGLLFLITAFIGAPFSECENAMASPVIQKAHILLMGALMFTAGALLALDHPVRSMMLGVL